MSAKTPLIPEPPGHPKHAALSRNDGIANQPKDLDWVARNIPCQDACPAHTRIPDYLEAIAHGRYDEAYAINLEDNVFPGVLGRVCARPCEPVCRHGREGLGEPVAICFAKRASADHREPTEAEEETPEPVVLPTIFPSSGKTVAVVGAGVAGLTTARDLSRLGHQVTVYEQHDEPGGMMVQGIPEFRLPRDVVAHEVEQVRQAGVELRCGIRIGRDIALTQLLADHDAVVMAAGTLAANIPKMEGDHLSGISHGLNFLLQVNTAGRPRIGRRVLIIGGGFTAMDCARAAIRLGADETRICYRRSRAEMPVPDEELEQVQHEGVPIDYMVSPIQYIGGADGQLVAVRFVRNELGDPGPDGRRRPIPVIGSEFDIAADQVLLATGQFPDTSWIDGSLGEDLVSEDHWLASGQSPETSIDKLFVAGDFALGATTLIDAIGHAKSCVKRVDHFLCGEDRMARAVRISRAHVTGRNRRMDLIRRHPMPNLPLDERDLTAEVETGYAAKIGLESAHRCYLCHYKFEIDNTTCIYCEKCLQVKPRAGCIVPVDRLQYDEDGRITGYDAAENPTPGAYPLLYIDQDECIRCGACAEICPVECISLQKVQSQDLPCAELVEHMAKIRG